LNIKSTEFVVLLNSIVALDVIPNLFALTIFVLGLTVTTSANLVPAVTVVVPFESLVSIG
jgi:hypothetical protein